MPTQSRRPPPEVSATPIIGRAQELRSYGRRRGRRLSTRQQTLLDEALPRLALNLADRAPHSLQGLFSVPVREVWLEIGFGGAEHLVRQARHNPHVGLIGCEVYLDGVVKAIAAIEEQGIVNVRVAVEDARDLLRWIPGLSLQRAFILFPDPWPKKRHLKRRLVNHALLDLLARAMAPGGELRIATDNGDYASAILLALASRPGWAWQAGGPQDWRRRSADWPETRYEQKAGAEGCRCYYLRFFKQPAP